LEIGLKSDLIKVGFCVAYDWPMLRQSLPLVYQAADFICISIDKEKISWAGNNFDFDERAFRAFIGSIDKKKKITVFEDDFHKPTLTPMENEVRQRNQMAARMGAGGWHIQLDADEYFTEFDSFANYLRVSSLDAATNVSCALITLFKRTENGFLFIDPVKTENVEVIAVASQKPYYEYGRKNGYFNHLAPFKIIHQSWARGEDEIMSKVTNWGHRTDFDVMRFVDFWKSLDEVNYKKAINFHPIEPAHWPALKLVKSKSVEELIGRQHEIEFPQFSNLELAWKNSKMVSRIKHVFRLLWN
jgi:hypothetical protein